MTRPRRGETPADLAARTVRREHRPPRSWPPALGGLCLAAALAAWWGFEWVPPGVVRHAYWLWWGGVGLACLGLLICRGTNRWASGLLLTTYGLLILALRNT